LITKIAGVERVAKPRTWKARLRRIVWRIVAGFGVVVILLWIGIHTVPWLGPALADGARAVVGPGFVAWAEDTAYAIEDRYNRIRYKDAKPKTLWETPSGAPEAPVAPPPPAAPIASGAPDAGPESPPNFPPQRFTGPFENVAADGDGVWIPIADPGQKSGTPALYKALVHPDPKRSFAAVAVVAMDASRVDLTLVSGTTEPESITVPKEHRSGVVPKDRLPDLIAAFNGGFKATHGHYGMMIGGETFLAPRDMACTVALYKDRSLRIRTWPALKDTEGDMLAYRQTPPCLLEEGKTNAALSLEYNRNWGATVSGETVIRRSAIGVAPGGKTIFYGLGEAVTAQALAQAMRSVGAENAAQLDVNYSYPRFLLYDRSAPGDAPHAVSALIHDIKFQAAEYVTEASIRDFFYVTRR
jgi:hypothetical protein